MRFADLLVDLAAVASASRSVASKHAALRAHQLDRFKKSSSIIGSATPQQQPSQHQHQHQCQQPPPDTPDVPEPSQAKASTEATPPSPAQSAEESPSQTTKEEPITAQFQPIPTSSTPEPVPPRDFAPKFIPVPWATGINVTRQAAQPRPPGLPRLKREPIEIPFVREPGAEVEVNVNVFRTRRGGSVLRALEEKEEKEGWKGGVKAEEEEVKGQVKEVAVEDVKGMVPEEAKDAEPEAPQDAVKTSEKVMTKETKTGEIKTPEVTREDAEITSELVSPAPKHELRESRVPASRIARLWNYGGLAAGMFAGAIGEGLNRAVGGGSGSTNSVMLSPANVERLVAKLSRMRGAALKMGQMMSFQDAKMLPGPIQEVLQRVQDRADYMPAWQRDKVLTANLGSEWRELFGEFEEKPIAAASIGQVHRATLKSNGARVAVKIQFPGVADSINSDLDNLSVLLAAANILPKGLYLNKTIDNARTELAWECDYEREAECAARYRELLAGSPDEAIFAVPKIYPEASGKHVLTMEFMDGVGVTRVNSFTQAQRDWIGTQILRLCLREIVEFRFMQTDPNWTNFLYNAELDRLELLDFGASREYPDEFISRYVSLLEASSRADRARIKELSEELGYLTGHESRAMLDAHITSVTTLAEPFLQSAPEVYDFHDQTITERVKAQIPVMIHERLAPPPEETYSLHRKLSGAFLLCARLGSKVRCRELFEQALEKAKALPEVK